MPFVRTLREVSTTMPTISMPSPLSTAVRSGRALALTAVLALVPWLAGCAGDTPGPAGATAADAPSSDADAATADHSTAARLYEVRGQVVRVPDPADPLADLVIRHEAIPDFAGIDGVEVGMDSMAMPFPLAQEASVDAIAPGDKVRFTLEVSWEGDPPYRITALEPLPPDTELTYRAARPLAEPPEEPPAEELPAEELPAEEPTPAAAEGSS
jgi:Cu/Ag efflux protein CusF